jgi:hypothetical protein
VFVGLATYDDFNCSVVFGMLATWLNFASEMRSISIYIEAVFARVLGTQLSQYAL